MTLYFKISKIIHNLFQNNSRSIHFWGGVWIILGILKRNVISWKYGIANLVSQKIEGVSVIYQKKKKKHSHFLVSEAKVLT